MNKTPKSDSPPRRGFFRRQFSWQGLRRALIGLLVLITLIALAVTEENWRGKHDWETYRHGQEERGERFDWQAFVPSTVPDDENFYTSLIFTNLLKEKILPNPYPKNEKSHDYDFGDWQKSLVTDLKPWQRAYRDFHEDVNGVAFPVSPQPQTPAADVVFALSKFDPTIEALRQASERPYANIPLPYKDGINASATTLLPYLAVIKRCAQVLHIRIIAELADGQSEKALKDTELLLYLNESLRNPSFLISLLVRMAVVPYTLQPIWEGLAEHRWSDAQLAALEVELAKIDFLDDYGFSVRCERALAIASFENQRLNHEIVLPSKDGNPMTVKVILMPTAYFYQNELSYAQISEEWILPLVDTNSRVISPANCQQTDAAMREQRKHLSPYTVQARMVSPAIFSVAKKIAFAQSEIDLARLGCALERYRLAHGAYPESLDVLEPQLIAKVPHDIINGQPLHYRLNPDGQFVLYSVGWNEADDGGQVVLTKAGRVDREQGDWVWQYPAKN